MVTHNDPAAEHGFGHSPVAKTILATLASLGGLFCIGIVTGITTAGLEKGSLSIRAGLIGTACLVIGVLLFWQAFRMIRGIFAEPVGKSTRRARMLTVVSLALGVAIGIMLSVGESGRSPLVSGDDISPTVAVILAVCALVVVPVLTLVWFRALDEHEAAAYSIGALVALNCNIALTAAWWVLAKGGLATPVEAMPIFLMTMVVWSAVWIWKRYF
ncbi:hypothetical protein [Croceicoccus sediminis]|uniref:hypothetical protein n=1 Tax=Croceicoccus sediminis TaxID=2571150 RepID=UPI0011821632|nr:hypothetical protein [Croceicoccus sediminis]